MRQLNAVGIAMVCHEANRAYCEALGDYSQKSWYDSPKWQQESAINGVNFHLNNPESMPEESHKEWLREKQEAGWVYGPVKDEIAKTHPCFVPYEELPIEQRRKDYLFLAIVKSLVSG